MLFNKRRQLLRACVLAGATFASGIGTSLAYAKSKNNNGMVFDFANLENPEWVNYGSPEKHDFEKLVSETFWVRFDDYEPMLNLTLEEVITISDYSFILRFHTFDLRKLTGVTHFIEHPTVGKAAMFLTANPVTEEGNLERFELGGKQRSATEYYYEATFNHTPAPTAAPKTDHLAPVGLYKAVDSDKSPKLR